MFNVGYIFIILKGGGESFDQLCDRSMNALEQIAKKHKGIYSFYTLSLILNDENIMSRFQNLSKRLKYIIF